MHGINLAFTLIKLASIYPIFRYLWKVYHFVFDLQTPLFILFKKDQSPFNFCEIPVAKIKNVLVSKRQFGKFNQEFRYKYEELASIIIDPFPAGSFLAHLFARLAFFRHPLVEISFKYFPFRDFVIFRWLWLLIIIIFFRNIDYLVIFCELLIAIRFLINISLVFRRL